MTYCAINAKLIVFSFKYTHTERGELLGVGLLCATNDKVQMEKHLAAILNFSTFLNWDSWWLLICFSGCFLSSSWKNPLVTNLFHLEPDVPGPHDRYTVDVPTNPGLPYIVTGARVHWRSSTRSWRLSIRPWSTWISGDTSCYLNVSRYLR